MPELSRSSSVPYNNQDETNLPETHDPSNISPRGRAGTVDSTLSRCSPRARAVTTESVLTNNSFPLENSEQRVERFDAVRQAAQDTVDSMIDHVVQECDSGLK